MITTRQVQIHESGHLYPATSEDRRLWCLVIDGVDQGQYYQEETVKFLAGKLNSKD